MGYSASEGEVAGHDVVVVGAGPAGCVVANRLSEHPDCSVLLLEEGPDWRAAQAPPEMLRPDWVAYREIPALAPFHRMDLLARRTEEAPPMPYFAGRGLGGSSTINAQIALRPPLEQFDRWAECGANGLSAERATNLYARGERDREFGDRRGHGSAGPVSIERTPRAEWSSLEVAFQAAAEEAGYAVLEDLNDGSGEDGVGALPYARDHGRRVTANHAYLDPIRERPNLSVLGGAAVDRVIFDGTRARGVRFHRDGALETVEAGRVVLCAGTIESAAILMRSGVGPAADLQALGLKVVEDLPVGVGVQDHPIFDLSIDWDPAGDPPVEERTIANCCLRYSSGAPESSAADMLLLPLAPIGFFGIEFPERIGIWLMEEFSRGSIRLAGTDPGLRPEVVLGLWSDAGDLERMRDGLRRAVDLLDRPAFAERGGGQRTIGFTGVPPADLDDDQAATAMILEHAANQAHLSSSCQIGEPGGEGAVVDFDGGVFGVEGLSVGDLSIAPTCPRAGPYLTAMALGEHVSERLRLTMNL